MSKKKNKHGTTFAQEIAKLTAAKDVKESISTSEEELKEQAVSIQKSNEQYLALSFKYITENKDYNFQAFKKDTTRYQAFITRLNNTLKKITSCQVKDLYNDPFKDKFSFSVLYKNAYQNDNKRFEGTEQIISVALSGKQNERIILYHEGKEVDGSNILYVLGFDFDHNMYPH